MKIIETIGYAQESKVGSLVFPHSKCLAYQTNNLFWDFLFGSIYSKICDLFFSYYCAVLSPKSE
jgi:hypothetical protein